MQLFLPATTIKAALAGFEALGLDPPALLAPAGLTCADLDDPFASVPNADITDLDDAALLRMLANLNLIDAPPFN